MMFNGSTHTLLVALSFRVGKNHDWDEIEDDYEKGQSESTRLRWKNSSALNELLAREILRSCLMK